MIEFINVNKSYINFKLEDINFKINKGSIFGILGESGSGKTTLLKMMNQLVKQDSGSIIIDDIDISKLNQKKLSNQRKQMGVVFQDYNLLKNLTIFENVSLPLKLDKVNDDNRVREMIDFVGLKGKENQYPMELSGGQRQRIALARALINKPQILLCDEPTSALDTKTTGSILKLLKKINDTYGVTIVIVTHELDVAKSICNKVIVMEQGQLKGEINVVQKEHNNIEDYYQFSKEVLES